MHQSPMPRSQVPQTQRHSQRPTKMDRADQPRLSETHAILVALLAFAMLAPILIFVLSIILTTTTLGYAKPGTSIIMFPIIAVVALVIDGFITHTLYRHFRTPRSETTQLYITSFSAGDWFSAIVSFGMVWLILFVFVPIGLQVLSINPVGPLGIDYARVLPPVVAATDAAFLMRKRRRKRQNAERERLMSAGLICACGYNLTGNISGVCPECGAMV